MAQFGCLVLLLFAATRASAQSPIFAAPVSYPAGTPYVVVKAYNGNFVNAEMVKAFITSSEYRSRFTQ